MSTPHYDDDGAAARIITRMRRSMPIPVAAAIAIAVIGWGWPGMFVTTVDRVTGGVMVALCLAIVPMLVRRVRLYRAAQAQLTRWPGRKPPSGTGWTRATCTSASPLSRTGGMSVFRSPRAQAPSRPVTTVATLRADSGPLAPSSTVFVRGRDDGATPQPGEPLYSHAVAERGPYLLGRPGDGVLFIADTWKSAPR